MQPWVRNCIVLAVMAVWAIVVLVSLMRGKVPDPLTWGVPGGLWALMAANRPSREKQDDA